MIISHCRIFQEMLQNQLQYHNPIYQIFAIHTAAIVLKGLMVRFKLSNYMVKFT